MNFENIFVNERPNPKQKNCDMKKILLTLSVFALAISFSSAQTTTAASIDINGVKAMMNSNGDLFWDHTTAKFEVPKGSVNQSNTIFAGATWIGGLDSGGSLHLAAQTYRQSGDDFFPGPVMNAANYSAANDALWNKVWKINKTTIDSFVMWTVNPSLYPNYVIPQIILNWPGNGDVSQGQAAQLAPYVDRDGDGNYNASAGDYPCIKGDQALFAIFNDDRNVHTETGGTKMKIEVHAMLYAYKAPGSYLDTVVFLNYQLFNRSANNYHSVVFGSWIDFDIGAYNDDYIGCDVSKNIFYGYNGDSCDGSSCLPVFATYGANPPAEGAVFLHGPLATPGDGIDNNRDGLTDEPGEDCRMNKFIYYNNDFSIIGNPDSAADYYRYMTGFWKDGTPITYGGNGYGGSTVCDFMFPEASDPSGWGTNFQPQPLWSEASVGNTPGDRRGMAAAGPFDLNAGQQMCMDFAFVFARGNNGPASSVVAMQNAADSTKLFYATTFPCTCVPNPLGIENIQQNLSLQFYPNPTSGNITVLWEPKTANAKLEIYDINGKIISSEIISKTSTVINMEKFTSGIYFMRMIDGKYTASAKVVKE
jgi:hypothetical protein